MHIRYVNVGVWSHFIVGGHFYISVVPYLIMLCCEEIFIFYFHYYCYHHCRHLDHDSDIVINNDKRSTVAVK